MNLASAYVLHLLNHFVLDFRVSVLQRLKVRGLDKQKFRSLEGTENWGYS